MTLPIEQLAGQQAAFDAALSGSLPLGVELCLYRIEKISADDCPVLTWMGLSLVGDFTHIQTIAQERVQRTAGKRVPTAVFAGAARTSLGANAFLLQCSRQIADGP